MKGSFQIIPDQGEILEGQALEFEEVHRIVSPHERLLSIRLNDHGDRFHCDPHAVNQADKASFLFKGYLSELNGNAVITGPKAESGYLPPSIELPELAERVTFLPG